MRIRFLILFLLVLQITGQSQLTYHNLYVDYDSSWQYKNLKLVPIRWKGRGGFDYPLNGNIISLGEALNKGLARISERGTASTENVHWLILENLAKKNIFVSSGNIIAGGRQDRMVSRDTIVLASQQRVQIPVMCVEEGRWSDKEKKFAYQEQANLHLRKVLDRSKNQVMIWREIYSQLEKNNVKNSTMAYLSRKVDKKFIADEQGYWNYFRDKIKKSDSTIVGFVCVSGNNVLGCDVYASPSLCYSELDYVLPGYINEAISFGSPINIPDAKIKTYMDKLLRDEASQAEFIKDNGKAFYHNGKLIHITTFREF